MNFQTIYEVESPLYDGVLFSELADAEAYARACSPGDGRQLGVRERLFLPDWEAMAASAARFLGGADE